MASQDELDQPAPTQASSSTANNYTFTHPRCGKQVTVLDRVEQPHMCQALPKDQRRFGGSPRPQALTGPQFARLKAVTVAAHYLAASETDLPQALEDARILELADRLAFYVERGEFPPALESLVNAASAELLR